MSPTSDGGGAGRRRDVGAEEPVDRGIAEGEFVAGRTLRAIQRKAEPGADMGEDELRREKAGLGRKVALIPGFAQRPASIAANSAASASGKNAPAEATPKLSPPSCARNSQSAMRSIARAA